MDQHMTAHQSPPLKPLLIFIVTAVALAVVGYALIQYTTHHSQGVMGDYSAANRALSDGALDQAMAGFDRALVIDPNYPPAFLGQGLVRRSWITCTPRRPWPSSRRRPITCPTCRTMNSAKVSCSRRHP